MLDNEPAINKGEYVNDIQKIFDDIRATKAEKTNSLGYIPFDFDFDFYFYF